MYDEAHHTEADTFRQVREYFDPLFELALTATPGRMDERDICDYFGAPLYSKTLAEGIAEGWLADVDYHIVFDDIVKRLIEDGFNPRTVKEFQELFQVEPRNESIAQNIREEQHKIGLDNAKTIVFCKDIAHAEEMAALLGGAAYHSEIKKADRKRLLQAFRAGGNKIICTVDMFNEGVDIPDARLLVFLRSTASGNVYEQQLGRGLRRAPGKKRVSVLDFVANIERIQKIQRLSSDIKTHTEKIKGEKSNTSLGGGTRAKLELHVHNQHSDFTFSKITVNLMDIWGRVTNEGAKGYTHFSNDQLVALALERKPHGILTNEEIGELSRNNLFVSAITIVSRFGSIAEFQKACVSHFSKLRSARVIEYIGARHMSNQDLINLARHLKPDAPLGVAEIHQLSQEGKFASMRTIYDRFGSIPDFQVACGFRPDLKNMSNSEIVALAKSLRPDEPLSRSEIEEYNKAGKFLSSATIVRRFGSLRDFHIACGFEILDLHAMSNSDIIKLAVKLSPHPPLSTAAMKTLAEEGRFLSAHMIRKRFGNARTFHRLCGF